MADLIFIFILILGFLYGRHKGFIVALYDLLSVIISYIMAKLITPTITSVMYNMEIDSIFRDSYTETANKFVNNDVSAVKEQFDYYISVYENIFKNSDTTKLIADTTNNMTDYFVEIATYMTTSVISFLVAFVLAIILTRLIKVVLKILTKLPIIGTVDKLLGGVLGIVITCILLWIVYFVSTIILDADSTIKLNEFIQSGYLTSIFFDIEYLFSLLI